MTSTDILLAASSDAGEAIGRIIGFLLIPVLGLVLLIVGLNKRGSTQGAKGKGLVIAGSIILGIGILGMLGSLTSQ